MMRVFVLHLLLPGRIAPDRPTLSLPTRREALAPFRPQSGQDTFVFNSDNESQPLARHAEARRC